MTIVMYFETNISDIRCCYSNFYTLFERRWSECTMERSCFIL